MRSVSLRRWAALFVFVATFAAANAEAAGRERIGVTDRIRAFISGIIDPVFDKLGTPPG
jgi:hypothetical protein